ncbi:MAG: VOC family protein [Chlorobia bacterium]|nr:VOC family protein [Fimbriimonadaceae bacterium]
MSSGIQIENITPVLGVKILERSKTFYVDALGFSVDWGFEEGHVVGSVSRDGKSFMLSEGEASGMTCWVGVEDILPFYERLKSLGIEIVQEPTNQWWAYEFRALDPDGNILWFGSEPLPE